MPRGTGKASKGQSDQKGLGRWTNGKAGSQTRVGGQEFVGWGGVDCASLLSAVSWATASGGALMLGASRDGFSLSVGIYFNGAKENLYWPANEDGTRALSLWLEEFAATLAADMSS